MGQFKFISQGTLEMDNISLTTQSKANVILETKDITQAFKFMSRHSQNLRGKVSKSSMRAATIIQASGKDYPNLLGA